MSCRLLLNRKAKSPPTLESFPNARSPLPRKARKRCATCPTSNESWTTNCQQCQLPLSTTGSNAIILEPEFPSLWGELAEQVTLVQVLLTLVLGGLITGAIVEIQELALELTLVASLLLSFFATLPLLTPQARNFHPVISGLLITLVIAPMGWVLLVLLNLFAQSLTRGLWGLVW